MVKTGVGIRRRLGFGARDIQRGFIPSRCCQRDHQRCFIFPGGHAPLPSPPLYVLFPGRGGKLRIRYKGKRWRVPGEAVPS